MICLFRYMVGMADCLRGSVEKQCGKAASVWLHDMKMHLLSPTLHELGCVKSDFLGSTAIIAIVIALFIAFICISLISLMFRRKAKRQMKATLHLDNRKTPTFQKFNRKKKTNDEKCKEITSTTTKEAAPQSSGTTMSEPTNRKDTLVTQTTNSTTTTRCNDEDQSVTLGGDTGVNQSPASKQFGTENQGNDITDYEEPNDTPLQHSECLPSLPDSTTMNMNDVPYDYTSYHSSKAPECSSTLNSHLIPIEKGETIDENTPMLTIACV